MAKVPVTARALIQRINRKLSLKDQQLKRTRGARAKQELGDYYVINVQRNILLSSRVNLERLGRELEALAEWEQLERE